MLINPNYKAGGWSPTPSTEWYGDNILVADEGGVYITTNLTETIPDGTMLCVSLYDEAPTSGEVYHCEGCATMKNGQATVFDWSPSTDENYTLQISNTAAGLTSYRGSYRKIYAKISKLKITSDQKYGEND